MGDERTSLFPAASFPDAADRELVWETLRTHHDEVASEYALQALDRIFDRYDELLPASEAEDADDPEISYATVRCGICGQCIGCECMGAEL